MDFALKPLFTWVQASLQERLGFRAVRLPLSRGCWSGSTPFPDGQEACGGPPRQNRGPEQEKRGRGEKVSLGSILDRRCLQSGSPGRFHFSTQNLVCERENRTFSGRGDVKSLRTRGPKRGSSKVSSRGGWACPPATLS